MVRRSGYEQLWVAYIHACASVRGSEREGFMLDLDGSRSGKKEGSLNDKDNNTAEENVKKRKRARERVIK